MAHRRPSSLFCPCVARLRAPPRGQVIRQLPLLALGSCGQHYGGRVCAGTRHSTAPHRSLIITPLTLPFFKKGKGCATTPCTILLLTTLPLLSPCDNYFCSPQVMVSTTIPSYCSYPQLRFPSSFPPSFLVARHCASSHLLPALFSFFSWHSTSSSTCSLLDKVSFVRVCS